MSEDMQVNRSGWSDPKMRRIRDGGVVGIVMDGSGIYVFDPVLLVLGRHRFLRREVKAMSCAAKVKEFHHQSENH